MVELRGILVTSLLISTHTPDGARLNGEGVAEGRR